MSAPVKCAYKPCSKYGRKENMQRRPRAWFCNDDCVTAYAIQNKDKELQKAKQAKRRESNAEKRRFKANDLPHQKELTRRVFNTFIRAMDKGKTCPTCGNPLVDGMYDAGHVRTVASCPQLRYDPRNCFGQCRRCNGSGTIRKRTRKTQEVVSELYKAWVLETLGQAYFDWLYGPHDAAHWSADDLAAMRKVFSAETRRLEAGQPTSRDWRALPM